jgi:hypothetical protein
MGEDGGKGEVMYSASDNGGNSQEDSVDEWVRS